MGTQSYRSNIFFGLPAIIQMETVTPRLKAAATYRARAVLSDGVGAAAHAPATVKKFVIFV